MADNDRIRVASVPAGHVYVRHLVPVSGSPRAVRLPDPTPPGQLSVQSQWWPPVLLDPDWIVAHEPDFDVFHIQFGFDALSVEQLQAIVTALHRAGKPLVYTAHDLRNPHHPTSTAHDAQLDVLIRQADAVLTLTPGAAEAIRRRWGRPAIVLPHPHVVPLDRLRPRRGRQPGAPFVVGVHAKSVRASMAPRPVLAAMVQLLDELADLELRVDVHRDVFDTGGARYDPELRAFLDESAVRPGFRVSVHDYFTDDELWDYLESLDVSVLPYRFGTHSGWLEACHDLGTTVLAPDCGFYAEQRRCLSYGHDENGLDADSLRDAVRWAYENRPIWQADPGLRVAERDELAHAHDAVYAAVRR